MPADLSDRDRHLGQRRQRCVLVGLLELHLGQTAVQVVVVGLHVEVTVTAQVEQDDALLAGFLRRERLVDRALDRVARFGRRDDPLRLRERDRRPRRSGSGV